MLVAFFLPSRLMVGQQPLELLILVRIQAGQQGTRLRLAPPKEGAKSSLVTQPGADWYPYAAGCRLVPVQYTLHLI